MPQTQTTTSQTDDNYQAIDPKKDPIGFVFQNKAALGRMDPDKAVKFVDMIWRRVALPKYQKVNQQKPLDEEEVDRLRLQFAARMFGIPYDQETKLKEGKPEYGNIAKAAATVEGAGAGVLGGIKTIGELAEKLGKWGSKASGNTDPMLRGLGYLGEDTAKVAGKQEAKSYDDASRVAPTGAAVGAAIGHQIPAAIATHGVEGMLPTAAKAAPLVEKVMTGAGRGIVGGATFEASRPGGDPESGAAWGGILGGAFPILGKMFGLDKKAASAVMPEVAKTVEGAATTEAPKNPGDVANKVAKDKFGKSFKELTSAEKAQMPAAMKEEIKAQQAVKQATKKAEVAAAKAGREAEETAKRAEKAKAAGEKAAAQATKRATVPTSTPVQKQAVAAQAAAENPSIAKTVAPVEKRLAEGVSPTGVERRVKSTAEILLENAGKTEGEKLAETIRSSSAKTTTVTEGEALQHLMKDSQKYEVYKTADSKTQGKMLVDAKNELEKITKIPEGQSGPKVRAKEGQSASPAQQAADRKRIAKKRELSKKEEFGSALEKHAQEMVGKHTSGSIGLMHIPEVEDAIKEFEGGKMVLNGLQKLRKAGRITDEIYLHEMKEWMMQQFEAQP